VIPSRFGLSPPSSAPAAYRRAPDPTTSLLDETFSSTGYVSDTPSSFGDPAPSRTTSVISPRLSRFSIEGRRIAPPTEFHPRLYPGSIRAQAARWRSGQSHSQTYPAIGMPWRSRPQLSEPALDSRSLIENEDDDIDLKFDTSNLELLSDLPTSRGETPVNRPLENPPAGTLEVWPALEINARVLMCLLSPKRNLPPYPQTCPSYLQLVIILFRAGTE